MLDFRGRTRRPSSGPAMSGSARIPAPPRRRRTGARRPRSSGGGRRPRATSTSGARVESLAVIDRPDTELQSRYVAADLPGQFDESVWFNETEAVHPPGRSRAPELPARHPFRLAAG